MSAHGIRLPTEASFRTGVEVVGSVAEAVSGADAAVIVTEWPELRELASPDIRDAMATPLIVDGRNLLDPEQARHAGFVYEGIGRRALQADAQDAARPPQAAATEA